MTVTFAADASSYQQNVDWQAVRAAGYGAGTEKCTEGTAYANPFWPAARAALGAAASPSFTPGVYHYLTAGNGAAQADWFARQAGPIPGFVIWCDLERAASGAQPTVADARAFTARVRQHYPGKRVGLYVSQSFTGNAMLTFADMLWTPHYVAGSGTPAHLYAGAPESWWNAYGGLSPVLLQFSQSATVPGVSGLADVSAFRGTAARMHTALLGTRPAPHPAPKPAHHPEDPAMLIPLVPGQRAVIPVWPHAGAAKLTDGPSSATLTLAGDTGAVVAVTPMGHNAAVYHLAGGESVLAAPGSLAGVAVVTVERTDSDGSAACTAVLNRW